MNTIILYGDKKDTQIKNNLFKILSDDFQINYICDSKICTISSSKTNTPLNIIETSSLKEVRAKNTIIILKNNAKINSIKYISKNVNIIINSNNSKNIAKLANKNANVYTCGFSPKDYVTFSSRNNDNTIVSLQRNVKGTDGMIYEPMEIPCDCANNLNDFSILAAILTLILIGKSKENKVIF